MLTRKMFFTLLLATLGGTTLTAQGPVYRPGEFRAPRYPALKANYTPQELLALACDVVRRPYQSAFLKAGYSIQPGHKALLVVPGEFDQRVLDAIVGAIREAGGSADVIRRYNPPPEADAPPRIETAWREAFGIPWQYIFWD